MSLIYSHINDCILIWGGAEKGIVESLFKLRKKAKWIISKSNYLDHTAPLFKSLKLLTVNNVYELNCIIFIYKCLNCNYFPELKIRIQKNSEYHWFYNNKSKFEILIKIIIIILLKTKKLSTIIIDITLILMLILSLILIIKTILILISISILIPIFKYIQ